MNELINEKVSVVSVYNRMKGITMPVQMRWQGRLYKMTKLAYHHMIREGRTILHVFHVTDGHLDFKLHLQTDTLSWTLIDLYDGTSAK